MLPHFEILPNQQSEYLLSTILQRSKHILERILAILSFRNDEVLIDHALRLDDIQPRLQMEL